MRNQEKIDEALAKFLDALEEAKATPDQIQLLAAQMAVFGDEVKKQTRCK